MQTLKSVSLYLYKQLYHFLNYIVSHPLCTLVSLAGVLAAFWPYAFAEDYYIDSEVVINIPGTTYNWLEIGRYGLVFCRFLLGTTRYNPYYTGILLLLFLWLTVLTLTYLTGKLFPTLPISAATLGSLVFITYPTFSEQYYFHYQSAEVAFGLWLSMIAAGFFYDFVKSGRLTGFVFSLLIYVLTFSIYQSFIPLALCCYLVIFLVHITKCDHLDSANRRGIAGSILHFLLAFGISQGIDRIFFSSSDYLGDQIIWSYASTVWEALRAVVSTCIKMFIGQGMFYTAILLLAVLAAGVVFVSSCCLTHRQTEKIFSCHLLLTFLSIAGIAITPFLLTMLMGPSTAARTQFTYPLAALFLLYYSMQYSLQYFCKPFIQKVLLPLIMLAFVLFQTYSLRLIWNAHSYITDHDRAFATEMMQTLYDSHVVCDGVGTIFWGNVQPDSPYDEVLKYTPSTMFFSVFNLEHDMQPLCYFSSIRILGYMESMGHKFPLPTYNSQFVAQYLMDREGLAVYPAEGCLYHSADGFVVNLGQTEE